MDHKKSDEFYQHIQDYFENKFPSDLTKIEFQLPDVVVQNHMLGEQITPFFGGSEWKHCREDLANIRVGDRNVFVLSIFMIVLTDQCLFRYHQDLYAQWRKRTQFPKFGWTGFGYHNENPFKLLWIPERDAQIEIENLILLIPDFLQFFKFKLNQFFPTFEINLFFENIKHDNAYQFNEGNALKAFKLEFEKIAF